MKNKILIITILAICAWLPIQTQALEHNFPAGSIIIPMDNAYQDEADGGLLEVYGLVYYLLQHKDYGCMNECGALGSDTEIQTCQALCPEDIVLNWVINDEKVAVDAPDVVIEDLTLPRDEAGVTINEVVRLSDKAFGTSYLTPDAASGDTDKRITYRGGLFIIDINELDRAEEGEDPTDARVDDLRAAMEIINGPNWSAVDVHIAQVPFAAPVHRKMQGTPPKIALMNNSEDDTGNAAILEAYLQLAGICPGSYEIVTPMQIAGLYADAAAPGGYRLGTPILLDKDYDFLWAPHWTGEKDYAAATPFEDSEGNVNATPDVDLVMAQIKTFVKSGKGILAECASIEVFEYNENGKFLSDKGFAHNGGTDNAADMVYADVGSPYAQIGDFGGFDPEGGHLHNWRPFESGDGGDFNFDTPPDVSGGNSVYVDGVTRFTADNTGWDYYVGGHAFGDDRYGYVVYLGGHKYAKCESGGEVAPDNNIHSLNPIEFAKDLSDEAFTLDLVYRRVGTAAYSVESFNFTAADIGTSTFTGTTVDIDLASAKLDKNKKIQGLEIINTDSKDIEIAEFYLQWENGAGDQKVKKVFNDTIDLTIYDEKNDGAYYSADFPDWPADVDADTNRRRFLRYEPDHFTDWFIDRDPTAPDNSGSGSEALDSLGCTANSSCEWTNIAGVRYVLNTLFNIKYDIRSYEYVRAAPVVAHPWLYQGSFEWPSYLGHFRRYQVDQDMTDLDKPVSQWDTAGHISDAMTGNADTGARQIFTGKDDGDGTWSLLNFDAANVANLNTGLNVLPDNGITEEENRVINRVRGLKWNWETEVWEENLHKLGGIMHSAPVIIRGGDKDSRFTGRTEVAYVGDLYGMLHAINTSDGSERWAYIPSNLLGKLQNNRTDPNATQDFAAVDGSPTAKDIYYDRDYDPDCVDTEELTCPRANRSWHTILICTQGYGGTSIFSLDVTDPDNWEVLWEITDTSAPGGGMGHAYRASLDRIKVPKMDPITGLEIPGEYEPKWVVYVATSYAAFAETHGGINVYAFDMKTGDKLKDESGNDVWFSVEYSDSVNDIPGAITTFDYDGDTFADAIFVGDMNGRLWELEAVDLSNPHGVVASGDDMGKQIPLFDAGVGNPISVSPAIIHRNGHVMVVFGTGGTDWASNDQAYKVIAVDATAARAVIGEDKTTNYYLYDGSVVNAVWAVTLDTGEKVWSSPTIAAGQILVATAFGTMESADPSNDLDGGGKLRLLDLDTGASKWKNEDETDKHLEIGKIRGSLYVSRGHVYMTDVDGTVIQIGDPDDYEAGSGNRVVLRSWRNQ